MWMRGAAMLLLCAGVGFVGGCGDGINEKPLDAKEVHTWRVPAKDGMMPAPRSISIGPHDEVLVLDNGGRILVYSKDGELMKQWEMPTNKNGNPEGACWLRDGRIVVADTHYFRLVFFDRDGNILGMEGGEGFDGKEGKYIFPVSIVQDEDGFIYVAEYGGNDRVQKFTEDYEFVRAFGKVGTGPGEFQRCAGLFLRGDEVWVADAENGRVHVFTKDGEFVRMLGQSKGLDEVKSSGEIEVAGSENDGLRRGPWGELIFDYPYDIALGPDDKVYVIEWGGGRFVRVSVDGKVDGYFGKPGTKVGEFGTPWGIGVDSRGKVRVADMNNRRVVEVVLE